MRLIDADRLMTKQMQSMYYHLPNGDIAIPIIDIEHAPTVEVPEIVRCRDCKYKNDMRNCYIAYEGCTTDDDWFCAEGERSDKTK